MQVRRFVSSRMPLSPALSPFVPHGERECRSRAKPRPVFEATEKCEHSGWVSLLAFRRYATEDLFDGAKLFRFVVYDEISFVAQFLDVLSQDARAERMKRGNGRTSGFFPAVLRAGTRDELGHALLHFAGGLVGEGHGQDFGGRDAAFDHVSDAESNDAGLARAGAGENEHGAANGLDGQALLRIEGTQVQHLRGGV